MNTRFRKGASRDYTTQFTVTGTCSYNAELNALASSLGSNINLTLSKSKGTDYMNTGLAEVFVADS